MKTFAQLTVMLFILCLSCTQSHAKADIADLYAESVMAADIQELEKILAPNFWFIGANGHIMDKAHFIADIKDKKLIVDRISLRNQRESKIGETRIITANGVFYGKYAEPWPQGLMRYTIVVGENHGQDEVVLVQATPVIATQDCVDGNCRIR